MRHFSTIALNFAKVQIQHLTTIQVQVIAWKPHNQTSQCWGFYVLNGNLLVDLEKSQMLKCIICRTQQASAFDLYQRFTLRKCFIKYGKINGIIPMKTHVESTHPKLVVLRMLTIIEKLVVVASHNQQSRKKWSRLFRCAITTYFGATTPYKKSNEAQQ